MSLEARKIRLIMELRRSGISDIDVLSAIERVPREAFVPKLFQDRAYENSALPIGRGQTLSQPQVVAMMTEALEVNKRMKVLEIGTGSGYQAAILSRLCRRVYTIERYKQLLDEAEQRFKELRLHNITTKLGDGYKGWKEQAPFERIIITAAPPEIPQALLDQLAVGGIMVLPLGTQSGHQELVKIIRTEEGYSQKPLGGVRFVPLVHGLPKENQAGSHGGEGEKDNGTETR